MESKIVIAMIAVLASAWFINARPTSDMIDVALAVEIAVQPNEFENSTQDRDALLVLIRGMIEKWPVGMDKTHVALVEFDWKDVIVLETLETGNEPNAVKGNAERIGPLAAGPTRDDQTMPNVIEKVRHVVFTHGDGDRSKTPNILILIVDGQRDGLWNQQMWAKNADVVITRSFKDRPDYKMTVFAAAVDSAPESMEMNSKGAGEAADRIRHLLETCKNQNPGGCYYDENKACVEEFTTDPKNAYCPSDVVQSVQECSTKDGCDKRCAELDGMKWGECNGSCHRERVVESKKKRMFYERCPNFSQACSGGACKGGKIQEGVSVTSETEKSESMPMWLMGLMVGLVALALIGSALLVGYCAVVRSRRRNPHDRHDSHPKSKKARSKTEPPRTVKTSTTFKTASKATASTTDTTSRTVAPTVKTASGLSGPSLNLSGSENPYLKVTPTQFEEILEEERNRKTREAKEKPGGVIKKSQEVKAKSHAVAVKKSAPRSRIFKRTSKKLTLKKTTPKKSTKRGV